MTAGFGAVVLAPSTGLGGGIERYLWGVQSSLNLIGLRVTRLNLRSDRQQLSVGRRVTYVAGVLRQLHLRPIPRLLLIAHPNLAPLAALLPARSRPSRTFVVLYGHDIWALKRGSRSAIRRIDGLDLLTISSYSAGALSSLGPARILPPGLDAGWYALLRNARRHRPHLVRARTLLTVFRLSEWRDKGLPTLIEARRLIRDRIPRTRLIIAGQGPVPRGLANFVQAAEDVEICDSPDDEVLARLYASADVFALCTRTRCQPPVAGEGFGIVLLEAQLAGSPVIGPAYGGSRDSYQDGATGLTPVDESPQALAAVLLNLLAHPERAVAMGCDGAAWVERNFDPQVYAQRVTRTLLGPPHGEE